MSDKIYRVMTTYDNSGTFSCYTVAAKDFYEAVRKVEENIKVKRGKQRETINEVELREELNV